MAKLLNSPQNRANLWRNRPEKLVFRADLRDRSKKRIKRQADENADLRDLGGIGSPVCALGRGRTQTVS